MSDRSVPVRSVGTTLSIVEGLVELGEAGVTQLATHLDLPKSTVHNHLATLSAHEYVVSEGDQYSVGLRFLEVGASARLRRELYQTAHPEVRKLARETGELAGLLVEEYGRGVFLTIEEGDQAVQVDTHAGKRIDLHANALGKAVLAFLPEETVEAIIERHGLSASTESTITDESELREELAEIRRTRVAFDDEERVRGLRSVATPILGRDDEVLGSVSVAAPTTRMREERFREEVPELVKSAANVVELNLKYA
jgi:DNA-binding IclR family transcriptional regulator